MTAPRRKSWLLRAAPDKNRMYYLKDVAPDGRPCYFFLLVEPLREQAFLQALDENQTMDLMQFGRVVTSGYGEASEALLKKMQEEFGASS